MGFEFKDNTPAYQRGIRRVVAEVTAAEVERMAELAASLAPVDTGALRDSIVSEVGTSGEVASGVVATDSEYAVFAHEGLGTHTTPHKFIERALQERSEPLRASLEEELSEL